MVISSMFSTEFYFLGSTIREVAPSEPELQTLGNFANRLVFALHPLLRKCADGPFTAVLGLGVGVGVQAPEEYVRMSALLSRAPNHTTEHNAHKRHQEHNAWSTHDMERECEGKFRKWLDESSCCVVKRCFIWIQYGYVDGCISLTYMRFDRFNSSFIIFYCCNCMLYFKST